MNVVVVILVLLPVAVLVAAVIAALVSVKRSSLRITADGVEIRNYPQPPKLIPLAQVTRFEATVAVGNFPSLRPQTGVLVLADGSRLPVRSISDPDAGHGVDALNDRLDSLRQA